MEQLAVWVSELEERWETLDSDEQEIAVFKMGRELRSIMMLNPNMKMLTEGLWSYPPYRASRETALAELSKCFSSREAGRWVRAFLGTLSFPVLPSKRLVLSLFAGLRGEVKK